MSRKIKNVSDIHKYVKGERLKQHQGSGDSYRPIVGSMEFSDPNIPTFWLPLDKRIDNFPGKNKANKILIHATQPGPSLMNKDVYILGNCTATTSPRIGSGRRRQEKRRPKQDQDGTAISEDWKWGSQWWQGSHKQASGHYTVHLDGDIDQHAPETTLIYHAAHAPTGWYNKNAVGIEFHFPFVNENPKKQSAPTEIMYKNGAKLVKDICKRRNIPIDRDHITYHKPNPGDPGIYWDWDYFMSLLKEEEDTNQPTPPQPTQPATPALNSTAGPIPGTAPATPKTQQQLNSSATNTAGTAPAATKKQQQLNSNATSPATNRRQNNSRAQQSTSGGPPSSQPNKTEKAEEEKEKKIREITPLSDDEIKSSLVGYYLPTLIKNRVNNSCNSFIHLETDSTTSYIRNLLFAKGKDKYTDFSLFNSLDLSLLTPIVELHKVDKASGTTQKHTLFPFDDYTNKIKLDSIFRDKTGRGGNVGIQELEWETVATNPSNVNQVMISLKIVIQDIQEIETIRNGISLLDFLYPAGSNDTKNYTPNNFNVKLRVGWAYKRQQNNKDLIDMDAKIGEKMLSETILATLHKHSFDFGVDGSVVLHLEYYGMLETEISDPYKFDVLKKLNPKLDLAQLRKSAGDFLNEMVEQGKWNSSTFSIIKSDSAKFDTVKVKAVEQKVNSFEKKLFIIFGDEAKQIEVGTSKWDEQQKKWVETIDKGKVTNSWWDSGFVDHVQKEIPEIDEDLENSFLDGIANLLEHLSLEQKINWIRIKKEQVDILKQISEIVRKEEILKQEDYKNLAGNGGLLEKTKLEDHGVNEKGDGRASELLNASPLTTSQQVGSALAWGVNLIAWGDGEVQGPTRGKALKKVGDKITLDAETFEKELLYDVIEDGEDGDLALSYVYFGDILDYYMKLFFQEKEVPMNHDLRMVIGTFSYRDIGELTEDSSMTGQSNNGVITKLKAKDGTPYKTISAAKKYANIADIPISMESLLNWYNNHILDSSLEKMSFNKFIRSLFNNVIPANLANSILPFGPKRKILPGFNYITTARSSEAEQEIKRYAGNKDPQNPSPEPKYKILMEKSNYRDSYFNRIRDKAEIPKINESYVPVTNYMFVTSLSERNKEMIADYKEDLERGIFHFYIGEDKGLVKEIKFSKEDNEKLDAANLVNANKKNLNNQIIRQIYNANITLFGNTIFYPGQTVHVSPTYPGTRLKNETLYKVGLGGYFQIIKIKNYVNDGKFETVLDTKWLTDGMGLEGKEFFLKVERSSSGSKQNQTVTGVKP